MLLTGNFGKSAGAARRTAAGADVPVKVRGFIGPDDDVAAVTRAGGIGIDESTGGNAREAGIGDARIGALEVTAKKHRATAEAARHIDDGGGQHGH